MKVDTKDVDKFINNFQSYLNFKAILLYGNDESSINTKFKKIIHNFEENKYSLIDISQENLKANPTILAENFFALSLFDGKNVITLRLLERENDYSKYIENLFNENINNSDNFIIITAGDLDKTSSLIKLTDKIKQIANIICYEEVNWNIPIFITECLSKENFIFNNDTVTYINNNLGTNKLIIENEIKKLSLYKGDDRHLSLADTKKCINDVANFNLNELINNFCSFKKEEFFRLLYKFFQEKNNFVMFCRMLINYFLQLQKMRTSIEKNKLSIDLVIEQEKIFWKQKNFIKYHLQKWNLKKINLMLEKLLELEKIKFNSKPQIFIENFFLKAMLFFEKTNL